MDLQHPDSEPQTADEVDRMMNEGGPDPEAVASEHTDHRSRLDRLKTFAREHPRLAIIGAAGIGMLAGLEVAAGVLIGAGVAAFVKLPDRAPPMEAVRDRARAFVERLRNAAPKHDDEH
jgi:hypothetical protein